VQGSLLTRAGFECSQTPDTCVYSPGMDRSRFCPCWLPRARGLVALVALLCLGTELTQAKPVPGAKRAVPAAFRKSYPASVDDLRIMERHVADLVHHVSAAVVSVRVGSSIGSAVVISKDGLVLCAAHVGGGPGREARFTFPDGRTARGETLGTNHDMDAGLMKITDTGTWPYVDVGSPGGAKAGDWVLALGHPGGYDADRSVVVRLGRIIADSRYVQTDCVLISGDSGGPLFDMQGQVVAIHSRISESTSENYHVPINTYFETWDRLANGENWGNERPRPWSTIGVRAIDDPDGCRLERVNEDGPGFAAGLRPGDLILRVNDHPVTDADCLVHCIRQIQPGNEALVLVRREGEELALKVKVESRRGPGRRGRGSE
jgi:serine protease Do